MFQKERLWEEPSVKQAPYAQCCQSLGFLFPLLSLFRQSRTDVLMSFLHLNREGNWQFIWTSHPIRKNEREKVICFHASGIVLQYVCCVWQQLYCHTCLPIMFLCILCFCVHFGISISGYCVVWSQVSICFTCFSCFEMKEYVDYYSVSTKNSMQIR